MTAEQLFEVLCETGWNVPAAADIIGIDRANVYKRIKKFGLKRPDRFIKRSHNGERTHCKRGHDYAQGNNSYLNKFGYRACRVCDAIRAKEKYWGKENALHSSVQNEKVRQPVVQTSLHGKMGDGQSGTKRTPNAEIPVRGVGITQCDVPSLPRHIDSQGGTESGTDAGCPLCGPSSVLCSHTSR